MGASELFIVTLTLQTRLLGMGVVCYRLAIPFGFEVPGIQAAFAIGDDIATWARKTETRSQSQV